MSRDLSDRLAKLENEIHNLLSVQTGIFPPRDAASTIKHKSNNLDFLKKYLTSPQKASLSNKGKTLEQKHGTSSSGCDCHKESNLNCSCGKKDCHCYFLASRNRRDGNVGSNFITQSTSDAKVDGNRTKNSHSRLPRLKTKSESSANGCKAGNFKALEQNTPENDLEITSSEDSIKSIERVSFQRQDKLNKVAKSSETKNEGKQLITCIRTSPSNQTLISESETSLRNHANTIAKEDHLKKRVLLKEKVAAKKQRPSLISVFETIEEEKLEIPENKESRPQSSSSSLPTHQRISGGRSKTTTDQISIDEKLRHEKKEQERTEILIAKLKEQIKTNQLEIEELARGKRAATEVAQSLRQKYESMSDSRQKVVTELAELRKTNVTLSQRLEQEIQNREENLRIAKEKTYAELKTYLKAQLTLNKKAMDDREKCMLNDIERITTELNTKREIASKAEAAQNQMAIKLKEIQSEATNAWNECARLKNELQASKEYAKSTKEERDQLRERVSELESKVGSIVRTEKQLQMNTTTLSMELSEKTKLALEMQEKCQQLEKEIQILQESDLKRVQIVENELQRFAKVMKEKEQLLLDEKTQLTLVVKDLNELVKTHKARIDELSDLNIKHEKSIAEYKRTILEKEEIIQFSQQALERIKEQKCELENRVNELGRTSSEILRLKRSISDKNIVINNGKEKIISLEKDLEQARKLIQQEKDDTLLKQKIIEDQAATIQTLKNQNQGSYANLVTLQNITKDLEKLQTELSREREQKDKIANTLTEVRKENEHLLMQVNELDHELILATKSREDQDDRKRQSDILSELETKLNEKQRKWNIQRQILLKEKNQAVAAARFATKKLVETVMEFQNQVEAQKRVQQTLTLMLSEKDAQLRNVNQKIKSLSVTSNTENPLRVDLERRIHDAYDACSNVIQHMRCGLNFVARGQQCPAEAPCRETFAEQFIS